MEVKTCQDCVYFVQHWYELKKVFRPLNCGHCRYPRVKHRLPETPACQHFREKSREQFVEAQR